MKRFVVAVVISMMLLPLAAFAQETKTADTTTSSIKNPSDMYPFRLNVVKVYQHNLGYRVVYRVGQNDFSDAYIPMSWFKAGGKAQLVRSNDPAFPYMVIYYRQGKFSHVRLYVKDYAKDSSWGVLEGGPEIADKFNLEEIVPKF
jgi:hypothetical protein